MTQPSFSRRYASRSRSDGGMFVVVAITLYALGINSVLIQTVATDDSPLKTVLRISVLALVAFAIMVRRGQIGVGILLLLLYSVVMFAVRQNSDQLSFIFVLVLVAALLTIRDERRLFRLFAIVSLASLALVFLFLAAGVTTNEVLEFRQRNTFGTAGVPFFYNLVYGAAAMSVLYAHKYKLKHRLLLTIATLAVATGLFALTDARGGYISLLVFIALVYLTPALSRLGFFRFATALLPVISLLFAVWIAGQGHNAEFNQLLSHRPALFNLFFDHLTPDDYFFSSPVKSFPNAVDNSYIHLLVGGGLVMCIAFFVIFARAVKNLFAQGLYVELAFVISTCIYFNSESIMLRIGNLFVICFWLLLFRYCPPLIRHRQPVGREPATSTS